MLQLEFAFASDIGDVRPTNQDSLLAKADVIRNVSCGLFCVADGVGGLSDGHFASKFSVSVLESWWNDKLPGMIDTLASASSSYICNELLSLFLYINDQIFKRAQKECTRIGTTCSALFILGEKYFIAHSGDTRIYATQKKLRPGNQIIQLTDDHTWLEDQLKQGLLEESEIRNNPKRNLLTGCLGAFETPRISVLTGQTDRSGMFILASDGLYRNVSNKELAKFCTQHIDIKSLTDELIHMSLKRGATDNVTVVAVRCMI